MAPLRNPKHEAFVRHLLEGKDATTAFELVGFKRDSGNAHRLFKNPKVQERLRELQHEIADKIPITIESLIGELEEARQHATGKNQFAAAIKAILGKAQLSGLLVEKQKIEVGGTGAFDGMEDDREIALKLADNILEFKFEAYHDFRDEDRQHIADLWQQCMADFSAGYDKVIAEVRARPFKPSFKLPKPSPDPHTNGRSRY